MRAIQELSKVVERIHLARVAKIKASLPPYVALPEGWVPDASTFRPGGYIRVPCSRLA